MCFFFSLANQTILGKIDYIGQRDQLNRMTELLRTNPFIHPNSVNFWYDDFQNWLNRTRQGNAQQQQLLTFFQLVVVCLFVVNITSLFAFSTVSRYTRALKTPNFKEIRKQKSITTC
jgi:hypothetical protein